MALALTDHVLPCEDGHLQRWRHMGPAARLWWHRQLHGVVFVPRLFSLLRPVRPGVWLNKTPQAIGALRSKILSSRGIPERLKGKV